MDPKNRVFLAIFALVISGCAGSRSYVSFEILEPASITFPIDVNQVGYLNRAPYSEDIFKDVIRDLDPITLFMVDSMVCNNLRRGFKDGTQNDGITYLDTLPNISLRRKDTTGYMEPISQQRLTRLLDLNNLDAVVSLDYFELDLAIYNSRYEFLEAQFIEEFGYEMKLLYRIYGSGKGKDYLIDSYQLHDTIYFVNRANEPSSTYVNGSDVVRLGSYEFGYRAGSRQIPKWRMVSRILYRGGSEEMRKSAQHVDNGNWEEAKLLWEEIADDDDVKLAAKALNNLAIYYETGDDIETAMEYANLAAERWENTVIEDYRQELVIRDENADEIIKQVR